MSNRRPVWEASQSQNPVHHTIRPHHIVLLHLLSWCCHPYQQLPTVSGRYILHIYRVLINEISEVTEPKSFEELVEEVRKGHHIDPKSCELYLTELENLKRIDVNLLYEYLIELPAFWSMEDDEGGEPLDRRSFFALFARRVFFSFRKLSFIGLSSLADDLRAWAAGDKERGYQKVVRDAIRDDNLLVRPQFDRETFAEADSFGDFEKARATGDLHSAEENLRRFFEQRFNDGSDSELRQHALLNLVQMHISSRNIKVARQYILEAITAARTSSDNVVLQQCMTLLRRIEGHSDHRREPLNEIQADIPALEILNDIRKLLFAEQPLSHAFEKIIQALYVYDMSRNARGGPPNQEEQWAFHTVQSALWRLAGCERLANIEENIVLAFSDSGSSDDSRFKALLNRSTYTARQGKEKETLGALLDPETWRGLDFGLDQVHSWSGEIWHTMLLFATRRGQRRQIDGFLKIRRPSQVDWDHYIFSDITKKSVRPNIDALLYRALQMRKVNQAPIAIDEILKALWQTEYQGRFAMYRLAIVLLADASLEFGMKIWSRRLIEEIMPQVINGDDLELRGFACYVLARCIIACCGKNRKGLQEALSYLDQAEKDYRLIEIQPAVQDILYVRAAVYNTLGMLQERNEAAERHVASRQEQKRLEAIEVNEHWDDVWNAVIDISAALASRT